jgi:hypothetical protein
VKHERKRPLVVMKVTEILVMKAAHAEEAPVQAPEHKPTMVERAKKAIDTATDHIKLPRTEHPSRTHTADGSGDVWTFPYSCRTVKFYANTFSQEALEKMRVLAHKPKPTPQQEQQIRECLSGKFQ